MFSGLLDLPWWGYVLATLALTHATIGSVTIYLHRHQAHRALELHPIASHAFRFWLWLSTGIITKEWAAIHRKHHAKCETEEDPHSPVVLGIKKVLLQGYELYRKEAHNPETMEKYGLGTPDDWIEKNIYNKHNKLGIILMLGLDLLFFGPIGLTIWAVQMAWIPVNAAGIINGAGHFWGYRNYACADASTNLLPWGIFIGGEELHNNHHAYASSAKLSSKWYELDIGWVYIRMLAAMKLAQVKKLAPRVKLNINKKVCDLETPPVSPRASRTTKVCGRVGTAVKTDIVNARSAKHPRASVPRMVNVEGPAVVGVPEITPAEVSVRPAGSVPAVTLKVYGAVPPLPVIVWL